MTTKSSRNFTCKKLLTKPCKTFINLFKFKLKKPVCIRTKTRRFSCLTSCFRSLRKTRDMDRVMELKSFSDAGCIHQKAPCPSPLTPAYIKIQKLAAVKEDTINDAEEACRSFENYLVKMIAEEGKMRDLVDVEELLYCWKNLKSPVFINLVCRFYGELCNDLFSSNANEDDGDDIRSLM